MIGAEGERGVAGADDTVMSGTIEAVFVSLGGSGCRGSFVSTVTAATAGACTRAGVCARLGRVLVPGGVRPEEDEGLGDTAGFGERGRLLGVAGEEALFLALTFGLASVFVLVTDWDCLFFSTFSLDRALFSFSFSRSLSFFSFFFFSNGVELRLCCRCVMSGVLAETLQRSALCW